MQVEDYLYQKDLYLPLVGEKPEAMNASEWAILDRKATATVRLSLIPQVAFNISKEKTNAAVMKALEKLYEKPSASNKVFLMKKLFNMRMSENGSVVNHINDFNGVTNQLESVGINFDDEIRALLFLRSLPDSWNNLVTTVSNSTISRTLTLNDIVSSVMNDEMRRKTIGDGISPIVFLRLGHLSESGMRILHSKNLLPGMKNIQLDFCEGYVYGKQKRVNFRKDGKERKTERLDIGVVSVSKWEIVVCGA
ncbi:hypothetical protein RJ640_016982 [Escallonia rubra]|uniref:GAG-pre-integrase domain-containing protein n=1 Tax=Escallonia rubra TaxID=112253 RepID=A0AA88U0V7_9ASTE|nr:hypothetical protein RJ640_016982 [Escallonia rubra]